MLATTRFTVTHSSWRLVEIRVLLDEHNIFVSLILLHFFLFLLIFLPFSSHFFRLVEFWMENPNMFQIGQTIYFPCKFECIKENLYHREKKNTHEPNEMLGY